MNSEGVNGLNALSRGREHKQSQAKTGDCRSAKFLATRPLSFYKMDHLHKGLLTGSILGSYIPHGVLALPGPTGNVRFAAQDKREYEWAVYYFRRSKVAV
jgi:hypothetical protein